MVQVIKYPFNVFIKKQNTPSVDIVKSRFSYMAHYLSDMPH